MPTVLAAPGAVDGEALEPHHLARQVDGGFVDDERAVRARADRRGSAVHRLDGDGVTDDDRPGPGGERSGGRIELDDVGAARAVRECNRLIELIGAVGREQDAPRGIEHLDGGGELQARPAGEVDGLDAPQRVGAVASRDLVGDRVGAGGIARDDIFGAGARIDRRVGFTRVRRRAADAADIEGRAAAHDRRIVADDRVVAAAAGQRIVVGAAHQGVVAGTAGDHVVSRPAAREIGQIAPGERVLPCRRGHIRAHVEREQCRVGGRSGGEVRDGDAERTVAGVEAEVGLVDRVGDVFEQCLQRLGREELAGRRRNRQGLTAIAAHLDGEAEQAAHQRERVGRDAERFAGVDAAALRRRDRDGDRAELVLRVGDLGRRDPEHELRRRHIVEQAGIPVITGVAEVQVEIDLIVAAGHRDHRLRAGGVRRRTAVGHLVIEDDLRRLAGVQMVIGAVLRQRDMAGGCRPKARHRLRARSSRTRTRCRRRRSRARRKSPPVPAHRDPCRWPAD